MTRIGENMMNSHRSVNQQLTGHADKSSTRTYLTIILATIGLTLLTFGVIFTLCKRHQDDYDLDEDDLYDLYNTKDHLPWDPELPGIDEGSDQ